MELVDLYDENRLPLGRTAERSARKGPGEYRMVVHVCVFDSRGRLLIQRRTPEKVIFPNLWDVSVGGGVDAGEDSRRGAEREFREELGYPLDLSGLRPSVTVNFDGGFDDFYILIRDLRLEELTLQREEVRDVRWASLEEVLGMLRQGTFIPYPESFLRFLFDMRDRFGFPTK
ncbi:NUDIX domain-containing protein [uncultured Oscillibacter sp.]|uniref:NUDIX hydrolase n=1 Tax=uncultured Oscillibacter sp. TaxID=876091 RepID=UPI00260E4F5B|nr:NUDIX domain-containing protein [uncultured Oscillibacter sp.]